MSIGDNRIKQLREQIVAFFVTGNDTAAIFIRIIDTGLNASIKIAAEVCSTNV